MTWEATWFKTEAKLFWLPSGGWVQYENKHLPANTELADPACIVMERAVFKTHLTGGENIWAWPGSRNADKLRLRAPKSNSMHSLSWFWTTNWKSLRKSLPSQAYVVRQWCNHFPNIACCWWQRGSPTGLGHCQSHDVIATVLLL